MKLIKIKTDKGARQKERFISFGKVGVITVSTLLHEQLNIKKGYCLEFYQDEDRPKDWYFSVNNDDKGVRLRDPYKNTGLMGNSTILIRQLTESLGIPLKSLRIPVGEPTNIEGVEYYPLITANIK